MIAVWLLSIWILMLTAVFGAMITQHVIGLAEQWIGKELKLWQKTIVFALADILAGSAIMAVHGILLTMLPCAAVIALECAMAGSYYWLMDQSDDNQEVAYA